MQNKCGGIVISFLENWKTGKLENWDKFDLPGLKIDLSRFPCGLLRLCRLGSSGKRIRTKKATSNEMAQFGYKQRCLTNAYYIG
jgi:hypothetical protein